MVGMMSSHEYRISPRPSVMYDELAGQQHIIIIVSSSTWRSCLRCL